MFWGQRNEIRLRLRKLLAYTVYRFGPSWMPSQRLDTAGAAIHEAETVETLSPERIPYPPCGLCTEDVYTRYKVGDYPNDFFELPERRCYRIEKAKVFMPEGIAVSQRLILKESLPTPSYLNMASFLAEWFRPRSKTNGDRVFLLGMPLVKNYHLWIHYALPRLLFWEKLRNRNEIPVVISKNSPKYVFQSLEYYAKLNPDFRYLILSRQELQLKQLFLAEPLGFRDIPHPQAIEWLRRRFLPAETAPSERLLYVTRKGASERDVVNEQVILDILEPLGFEIFNPGHHSFVEQVKAFSQARIVVGPHGAGFANMAFAPLKSRLVELIGGSHLNPCFRYLMGIIDGTYAALPCDSQKHHIFIDTLQKEKLRRYLPEVVS